MITFLLGLHVFICITLIILILMQRGKGADMGSALGAGASQSVFGSQGSHDTLSQLTYWFAAAFFIVSLLLTIQGHRSVFDWSHKTSVSNHETLAPLTPNLPE